MASLHCNEARMMMRPIYINDDDETYVNDIVLDSEHVVDGLERRDA